MNAAEISAQVHEGFEAFRTEFTAISRRAARRFADRDPEGHRFDATERLRSHQRWVTNVVDAVRPLHVDQTIDLPRIWRQVRQQYALGIAGRSDSELAETFFNSVTRRVFELTDIDEDLEFRWFGGIQLPQPDPYGSELRVYERAASTEQLVLDILIDLDLRVAIENLDDAASRAAEVIDRELAQSWETPFPVTVDILRPAFYRNAGCYIVGRIRHLNRVSPLVLAIVRTESGARVDAVMVDENDVSRVFGFTRAYFHVNTSDPTAVIGFVKSIIPLKPVAELYTTLGWNQHGKTALYRGLRRHLDNSADRFELTRGARGMVMVVFSLPSFDVVFKVIRDSFDPPKQTTRRQVKEKYRLVFDHDRAGRMVDAQEFEHLALPRDRFLDDVIDQLTQLAPSAVTINDEHVVLHHVYTERRVHPLDLYLAEVGHSRGRRAVTDYGQAIKDLAAADIFPGDLFTKNFGVTRHGTVVFYDYDEIMLLSDCRIRELPQARNEEDELRSEPWFSVEQNDVFPTEFRRFLRFGDPELQAAFDEQHNDLWTTEFWRRIQRRHAQGDPPPVFPYPADTRLT